MKRDQQASADQLRDDPEVQALRDFYVSVGVDDAEAQRLAEFDVEMGRRYWPQEDAETRGRKCVEIVRRYWFPDEKQAP